MDAGYCVGIEIHPFAGIIIGARYSVSLTRLFNDSFNNIAAGGNPSVTPNFKNNVVLISLGYRF